MPIQLVEATKDPRVEIIFRFGTGDIAVAPANVDGHGRNTVILFDLNVSGLPTGKVGEYRHVDINNHDLKGIVARLEFRRPESVDVVIRALEEVKSFLMTAPRSPP